MIFTDPNGINRLDLGVSVREGSAPPTPAATFGYIYAKTDGKIYFKNDAGTEYDLTDAGIAGVAWGSISGTLSSQTDLQTALNAKEDALGFTAVPDSRTVNGHALTSNVTVTKGDVGLGNADNTSDANKPISTATQTALDLKTGIVATITPLTAQAAAIAATTAYTTPAADGWYRINIMITVTQAATTSSTIGFQFRYTAAVDNVVKTWPTNNNNGLNQTNQNTTAATLNYSGVMFCKANTNIQYITSYTSSGGTPMQYSVNITVEKL